MMHDLENALRRPVEISHADDAASRTVPQPTRIGPVAIRCDDWDAVEEAAVAAAEAVAAAAAAHVAREAAITAQAAVDAACAAAARAARRAQQVAADAAGVVAAAALVQQYRHGPDLGAAGETAAASTRAEGPMARSEAHRQAAADQCAEAERVAGRVVLVAAAAATAAVDAALVVAAQLDRDEATVAGLVGLTSVVGMVPAADAAVASPAALPVGMDSPAIHLLVRQRASAHTIAAALNASGSRTSSHVRWTAKTVKEMQYLSSLPSELVPAEVAAAVLDGADLLAVAELARVQAEQGFEEAQRLGGLGSWSWTVATDEVTWSEHMYRLCGADPTSFQATYAGFLATVHPDDREYVAATIATMFEGAPGYEVDHRVLHPNGNVLWLRGRGAAIRDDSGAPVRLYGTAIDMTATKLAEQRDQQHSKDLARLTSHDSLTGLANRSLLHDRLGHALNRRGHSVSVLLLDLDGFKAVNDGSGHAAGDRLLVDVAGRLLQSVRDGDTVARLGGDEFAIVVEQGDPQLLAERIMQLLAVPVLIGGRPVTPVASIGIATADGAAGADELLVQADVAMYAAKAAGKGNAAHFDAAMADQVRVRTDLHEGLRDAVSNGEIVVHYQPIMSAGDGDVTRVEALVRWQRPAGLVPPCDFLPLAEETGLIVGIGKDVLRQACEQLHGWLAADTGRSVSVNVSAMQLVADDFAAHTLGVLGDAGVDPHQVVLEVTETLFLNTTAVLTRQLERLRRRGIRVSIDDFGTGYSSLGRLHRLPIDSIKIDKTFVDLLRSGVEFLPLVNSMIVMAHALHLDVTAEGVETAEQANCLIALGCDYLQGFYFAKPTPVATATASESEHALEQWCCLNPLLAVAH